MDDQPYAERGAILRRQLRIAKVSVREMAGKANASEGQLYSMFAGKTWNDGTAARVLKELGLDDDIFGDRPEPSVESKALTDSDLWAEFPDDVKVHLLIYGKWLSGFDVGRRFVEAAAWAEFLRGRQSNG